MMFGRGDSGAARNGEAGAAVRTGLPVRRYLPSRNPTADDLKAFWPKFWRSVGKLPFAEELGAAWFCWADPKTPSHVKAILAVALAYFVVPTDLTPDFIAGLGFVDDAAVLTAALGMVSNHVKRRHKQAARKLMQGKV